MIHADENLRQQLAEAHRRYERAATESAAAQAVALAALNDYIRAGEEVQRLSALNQPLRQWLLDALVRHQWSRPPTVRRLSKLSYRREADVHLALAELMADGLVRPNGAGYEKAIA